jgi:hypothetical protein
MAKNIHMEDAANPAACTCGYVYPNSAAVATSSCSPPTGRR